MSLPMTVLSVEGVKSATLIEKLTSDYFDRTERFITWRLLDVTQQPFTLMASPSINYCDFATLLEKGFFIFSKSGTCLIFPEFYTRMTLSLKPVVHMSMVAVGKTSYTMMTEVRDHLDNALLTRSYLLIVNVSMETRRPSNLPEWFIEKYSSLKKIAKPELMQKIIAKPQKTFTTQIKIHEEDIDQYGHTNNAVYGKYCQDCASLAVQRDTYASISGDINNYRVDKMGNLFIGETRLGDMLSIETWEDNEQIGTLQFIITKDGKDVYHGMFHYYEVKYSPKL